MSDAPVGRFTHKSKSSSRRRGPLRCRRRSRRVNSRCRSRRRFRIACGKRNRAGRSDYWRACTRIRSRTGIPNPRACTCPSSTAPNLPKHRPGQRRRCPTLRTARVLPRPPRRLHHLRHYRPSQLRVTALLRHHARRCRQVPRRYHRRGPHDQPHRCLRSRSCRPGGQPRLRSRSCPRCRRRLRCRPEHDQCRRH
jgi:hypothetical protein